MYSWDTSLYPLPVVSMARVHRDQEEDRAASRWHPFVKVQGFSVPSLVPE